MKVFLSHATEDTRVGVEICQAMRGAGHTVFFDADDLPPGGDYHTRIRDAIAAIDAFVFVQTPNSLKPGKYTLSELKFAKQRWSHPAGHVLSVMVQPVAWSQIDPWLASATILQPAGNAATEAVAALEQLPETVEAKAATARVRSPVFATQVVVVLALALAWLLTLVLLGGSSDLFRRATLLVLGVAASAAVVTLGGGAVVRARDPAVRSLVQGCQKVMANAAFATATILVAGTAAGALIWQLAGVNRVKFVAEQDVELLFRNKPLAVLRAGDPASVVLPVGRCSIAYRPVGIQSDEIGVLDPFDVPRLWSGRGVGTITVPKLQRFDSARPASEER